MQTQKQNWRASSHKGKKVQRTITSKNLRKHSFTNRTTSIQHRNIFKINVGWVEIGRPKA